jgi:hypothetical protein
MQRIYQKDGKMANSKFDMSLLEPIDEKKITSSKFNSALLTPVEEDEEEQFLQPKQEGLGTTLPRDIIIGLSNLGHKTINTPYDIAKNIEQQGNKFGQSINKTMPLDKYLGENRLPNNKSYLQQMVESFNKKNNVPEELQNKNYGFSSENIPHQQEYDFASLLGQKGTPSTGSQIIQKGIEYAPELATLGTMLGRLPITSRGIISRMSGHKQGAINQARTDYGNLFNEASQQGITHVFPPESAIENRHRITANSQNKYNRSLNEYIQNPTLENAHRAQSELGALERHLDSVANKNGLTPSQHRTLRATQQTRGDIRQQMLGDNGLGSNPQLAEEYQNLTNIYREQVVPYTRLEELTETEQNRMRPKTAVKKLLKDEQFLIELSRRYPGLMLHTPRAKSIKNAAIGVGTTIGGWEGIKKLLK